MRKLCFFMGLLLVCSGFAGDMDEATLRAHYERALAQTEKRVFSFQSKALRDIAWERLLAFSRTEHGALEIQGGTMVSSECAAAQFVDFDNRYCIRFGKGKTKYLGVMVKEIHFRILLRLKYFMVSGIDLSPTDIKRFEEEKKSAGD